MTQDEAFLQAIIESPNDDTPRLVYADWLDEHGDADRAEFIRVQCLQAKLPWDDDRQSELLAREAQLLARHYEEWTAVCGDWPDRESDGSPGIGFRRGFIERLRDGELDHFLERAPTIFAACPVRGLRMELPERKGPDLAVCSSLGRLRTLRLRGLTADVLEVCRSPHLVQLETLDLSLNDLRDEDFRELVGRPGQPLPSALQSLRFLCLGPNRLTDDALAALAASPLAHTLTGLNLADTWISSEGIRLLLSSPLRTRLEELDVTNACEDGRDTGRVLGAWLGHSRLRHLSVAPRDYVLNHTGNLLVCELAAASRWGPLQFLSLNLSSCGTEGLGAMLDSPHVAGLTYLGLATCCLDDRDAELLAACPRLCGLTALELGWNGIGDRGVAALAASPFLTRLTSLHLGLTRITDAGVVALARSPNVERLRHLTVYPHLEFGLSDAELRAMHQFPLSDAALQAIGQSPRLECLYTLVLYHARLTDAGAVSLARSPHLRCLTFLHLDESALSEVGRRALRQATHGVWGRRGPEERSEPFFSWEA